MSEKERTIHDEWDFYGSDFGGKVDGLIAFENENVTGIEVVRGKTIGASFFREFILQNRFFNDETWPNDVNQTGKLPEELEKTNRQILSGFPPQTCIAIRSSVVGENRGIGIYSSYFMVTTGNIEVDLKILSKCELDIYADYFSSSSRDFLGDQFLADGGGVGLLIQKVIGDRHGEFFMPAISGVATFINGELNLRLVIGLGTRAVEMKDAIVLKGNNLSPEVMERAIFSLHEAEAISLVEKEIFLSEASGKGKVFLIGVDYQCKERIVGQVSKLSKLIDSWRKLNRDGTPYYWEFAVTEAHDRPQILQVNREEPFDERTTELGPITGRVMCESNDVVNIGTKTGHGIVYLNLSGVILEDLKHLYVFNETNRNYLLIIDDILFSQPSRREGGLSLSHFSNAAGVIERQHVRSNWDPHQIDPINHIDRGGTHFIEVCKRKDILFQGVVARPWDKTLEEALGPFYQRLGDYGGYWDLEFKMVNVSRLGRVETFGQTISKGHSREKLHLWSDELRDVAGFLESEDKGASDALYYLGGYLITAAGRSVADYDPYGFIDHLLPETLQELASGFDAIFQNLYLTESYATHQEGLHYGMTEKDGNVFELEEYLLKLKQKIQDRLAVPNL